VCETCCSKPLSEDCQSSRGWRGAIWRIGWRKVGWDGQSSVIEKDEVKEGVVARARMSPSD